MTNTSSDDIHTEETPFVQKGHRISSTVDKTNEESKRGENNLSSSICNCYGKGSFGFFAGLHERSKRKPKCPHWFAVGCFVCFLCSVTLALLCRVSQLLMQTDCVIDPIKMLEKDSYVESKSHGVVASDHRVCSNVGVSILRDGGNAIDATVATVLCLGVANPASSGLGGGAFLLIRADEKHFANRSQEIGMPPFDDKRTSPPLISRGKILEVIDCRETAPSASRENMFANEPDSASSFGGLAVAVPGELRGLELAHARHVSLLCGSQLRMT